MRCKYRCLVDLHPNHGHPDGRIASARRSAFHGQDAYIHARFSPVCCGDGRLARAVHPPSHARKEHPKKTVTGSNGQCNSFGSTPPQEEVDCMAQRGRPGLTAPQNEECWRRWNDSQPLTDIGLALGTHAASIHGVAHHAVAWNSRKIREEMESSDDAEFARARAFAEFASSRLLDKRSQQELALRHHLHSNR